MIEWILGSIVLFLLLWLIFFLSVSSRNRSQEKKAPSQFLLPVPALDREKLDRISGELLELGFVFVNNFDKAGSGMWPSPVKLYAHRELPAFAEVSVLPTEEIQVQFITLFVSGSLTTTAGERLMTFRFMSDRDQENWEGGSLSGVWNAHQAHVRDYRNRTSRSPLPATEEGYLDLIAVQEESVRRQLKEEQLVPRTILDYLFLGYICLSNGEIMQALEMFQGAVNMDPDKPYLHRLAGKISIAVQNYEAATQYFYEAVDLDSENKEGYVWLADSLMHQNKKQEAYGILTKARERFPGDSDVALRHGILATQLGELEEARASLDPLDGTAPSRTLFLALASLYTKLGDSRKAAGYQRLARVFAKQKDEWKDLPWSH